MSVTIKLFLASGTTESLPMEDKSGFSVLLKIKKMRIGTMDYKKSAHLDKMAKTMTMKWLLHFKLMNTTKIMNQ